ncbi:MAG: discoidin domain-containing protein, partial [Gemmatimonadales bacterium]|nr:discoidin domain-containing protein [Gemmatimonadales bacterium]
MIAALLLVAGLGGQADTLAPRLLDSFERPEAWSAHPADGVRATLRGELGHRGHALRMDFDFQGGGGYAIARRTLPIDLPANYAFTFWLRATGPANTLEFKLVDASGENVWWYTERDRSFDGVWRRVTIRKRQITYAWGPQGGGELGHVAALELVITAGRGGRGTVWFDELELTPLPVAGPYTGAPLARAWSSLRGAPAALAVDGDTSTAWRNAAGGARDTATGGPPRALTIDFGRPREFGGLSLFWRPGGASATYDVELSDDGRAWRTVRRVTEGNGGRDDLQLPDTEARWLRLLLRDALAGRRFALGEVVVQPLAWGATRNAFFGALAALAPAGSFPRYWSGRRAYWTVVGLDAAREEALFGEDGAAEVGKGDFSVEPFLRDGGRTLSWHDVTPEPTLEDGVLPIPSTTWRTPGLSLTVTAFAVGEPSHPNLVLRYRVRNEG